eukprot:2326217-Amphidinium_carterae.1
MRKRKRDEDDDHGKASPQRVTVMCLAHSLICKQIGATVMHCFGKLRQVLLASDRYRRHVKWKKE